MALSIRVARAPIHAKIFCRSRRVQLVFSRWVQTWTAAQTARLRYSVILDGWCVPEQPLQCFLAGKQASVPLLIGSNARESDEEFTVAARFFAREHSKLDPHTYRYFFSRGSDEPNARGPIHAAEIDYVFNAHRRRAGSIFDPLDRDLARTMSSRWVQFARTGDPNPVGEARRWPPYEPATDPYVEFGSTITIGMGLRSSICDDLEKAITAKAAANTRRTGLGVRRGPP